MAREDNLIPNSMRSPEELRQMQINGGIKSGIARRKKKKLKDLCNLILENKLQDKRTIEGLKSRFPELDIEDVTFGLVLLLKQYEKAKDGDSKAFEILRDTSGQSPVQKQEIDMQNMQNVTIRLEEEDTENGDY